MQFTHPDQISDKAPSGCYVSGLYLEGAKWDLENRCLVKSLPKVLTDELPILRIIPIEAHRLKLVVSATLFDVSDYNIFKFWLSLIEYLPHSSLYYFGKAQCHGRGTGF